MPRGPAQAHPTAGNASAVRRLMWLTPERVFYVGLLGAPSRRTLGSLTLYAALQGRLRLRIGDGPWRDAALARVPPYLPHEVASPDQRHVMVVGVEPETVDLASLPSPLAGPAEAIDDPVFADHLRRCHAGLAASALDPDGSVPADAATAEAGEDAGGTLAFDTLLFGGPLPARVLDRRIAEALHRLRRDPAAAFAAEDAAAAACLSPSRFLHLFKAEVGTPLRTLRSWKRARSLLRHVRRPDTLLHVALDAGYPDATHFSHSIRQVYGLRPRDIFAGSRRLRVIAPAPPA